MASGSAEKQEDENAQKDSSPQRTVAAGDNQLKSPTKKRRKVNHACIYCRRSHMTCDLERPCTRCIKRNIGHLCHDEPREPAKKQKTEMASVQSENTPAIKGDSETIDPRLGLNRLQNHVSSTAPLVQPTPVPAAHRSALTGNNQVLEAFQDWNFGTQSHHFQDIHQLHPQYMFNASEVSNEYNLLNEFLSNSLVEDGALFPNDDVNGMYLDGSLGNSVSSLSAGSLLAPNQHHNAMLPPSQAAFGNAISRPASSFPIDKAREAYYMTAADPAGSEPPEERLKKLLKAKYDAGMLKPFNYVKGYARLNQYMERHLQHVSRMKILRQLDKFRPKFRERIQGLTDMQLTYVEMHFERSLMEYDRVFASMAIPACCWRRTGEIYRGNKEMAELIHAPIENLKDGKIAIHEIFAENSLVSYWEKFGAIAFDSSQKAILTTCALKSLDNDSKESEIRCCFSFTIRRDTHNIPNLIVGNFLPILPSGTK